MRAALQAGTSFLVPMKGQGPEVGFVEFPFTESLQDEVAELIVRYFGAVPCAAPLALDIAALLKRRALDDIEDFPIPLTGQGPEVGFVEFPFTESLQDEVAELIVRYFGAVPCAAPLALDIAALLKRRALDDIEDFPIPLTGLTAKISAEQERRLVAAHLGRLLDWICKGRGVLEMGPRAFVVASHIRASAVDHRTDQEAAREIGNDSRASVNKIKGEFRRALGADYPGESGKGSNTKARCRNSRIKQLKN